MKKLLLLCCCLMLTFSVFAQQRVITGKVTDADDGSGLPGVSVLLKGTSQGAVSDSNGSYSIEASPDDVLVFSFIGYTTTEVPVGAQTTISLALVPSVQELQEIVVIGYGERDKKDLTGAISSIDSREITKSTAMTPELAMQGRMAGVFVGTPSGSPFARPTIQIRGVATFGYSEPLYVIDGVPIIEGGAARTFAGEVDSRSPININTLVNPNDIESISVLKDASSAAIYGVRASNGVILITTKKGKLGKPKVDFSVQKGVQNLPKQFDVLNTQDYTTLYQEIYANNPLEAANLPAEFKPGDPKFLGNSPTYNWQDKLINKNAAIEDYSIRVSGANEATSYYVSTGYGRTEGSLTANSLERYSMATNVTSHVSKLIETGVNLKIAYSKARDNTSDLGYVSTAPPWQPIYDANDITGYSPSYDIIYEDDPNPDFDPGSVNPGPLYNVASSNPLWGPASRGNVFAQMDLNKTTFDIFRTLGSAYVQLNLLKGLTVKGTVSTDYTTNVRKSWSEYESNRFSQTPGNKYAGHDGTAKGSYGERETRNMNLIGEVTVNYNRSFGDHNFDLLVNAMDQKQTWRINDISSGQINSTDPALRIIRNTPPYVGGFTSVVGPQVLQGYFARVSYKFRDKYYLDATVRRDGSSYFAPEHRWGTFPSIAGGWRISGENFFQSMDLKFLNDLKIRGGWGELGNKETTQGFAYLSLISVSPDYPVGSGNGDPYGQQTGGVSLPNFPNVDLTWERVRTSNIGFDAVLLNNHLTFTAEYYNRFTKGIIQSVQLPPNTGIQSFVDLNVGNVRNNGIELQLGYNNNIGDVGFNASANFTTVKNRVVKLYQGTPFGDNSRRVQEGYSIGYLRGFEVGGIFQNQQEIDDWLANNEDGIGTNNPQPGDMWFRDIAGNPVAGEIFNPVTDSVVNNNDVAYMGKSIAGFFYGFNFGATYKGFDVSVFFQGTGDVQKYNYARNGGEQMSGNGQNQWVSTNDRWTIENPSTTMPRAVRNDPMSNNRFSTRYVENASFMRLKNFQVGYSFPASMLSKTNTIERLRIYFSGTNVLTFTKWSGLDPENDFFPPARQFMFGINATF